jgi:hypothetical protein
VEAGHGTQNFIEPLTTFSIYGNVINGALPL